MDTDSSTSSGYEFSAEHNAQFKAAAYWMGIMGRLGILFGALLCLSGIFGNIPNLIGGIIGILMGVLTWRAGAAFGRVAGTTGRDIENVIEAVTSLKSLYRLQAIMIGVAIGLIIGIVVYAMAVAGR
jgi:Family of unknown function (DUF5362)